MKTNPWFIGAAAYPRRLRLYCFSHAGGSAAGYLPWQGKLGDGVEVCAIQLPGRASRYGETPYTDMAPLAAELAAQITRHADLPFAFFGHSLGALLAFETARRLHAAGGPLPERLIASGCEAPPCRSPSRGLHRMADQELTEALRNYNGSPPEVLANRDLMALLLPMIRADFSLVENYHYVPAPALPMPLSVYAGRRDDAGRIAQLERWQEQSAGPFGLHWFEGDHFFIQSAQQQVWQQLAAELAATASAPAPTLAALR